MKNFDEFWPHYLKEHAHPKNRKLHFVGTAIVHVLLIYVFITGHIKILWFVPLCGYSFAWAGHFFVEKNRPATFKYPLWSLMADFRMFYRDLLKKV